MSTAYAIEKYADAHEDQLYRGHPFSHSAHGLEAIGDSDIRWYRENGYLIVKEAFSKEEAAAAREELSAMCSADDPNCLSIHFEHSFGDELTGIDVSALQSGDDDQQSKLRARIDEVDGAIRSRYVRKFVGFTSQHPPLKALSHSKDLRSALKSITGRKMKLFVSQALIKPPGGREKPWHQDHAYFDVPVDTPIVGCWIALDRATPENGCMHFWPGGHKAGARIHFQVRDWQLCDTDLDGVKVVSAPLEAGDLILFDGKIPHGTPTNTSGDQRWAVQYHYIPTDVEKIDKSIRLEAFGSEGKEVYC